MRHMRQMPVSATGVNNNTPSLFPPIIRPPKNREKITVNILVMSDPIITPTEQAVGLCIFPSTSPKSTCK